MKRFFADMGILFVLIFLGHSIQEDQLATKAVQMQKEKVKEEQKKPQKKKAVKKKKSNSNMNRASKAAMRSGDWIEDCIRDVIVITCQLYDDAIK